MKIFAMSLFDLLLPSRIVARVGRMLDSAGTPVADHRGPPFRAATVRKRMPATESGNAP